MSPSQLGPELRLQSLGAGLESPSTSLSKHCLHRCSVNVSLDSNIQHKSTSPSIHPLESRTPCCMERCYFKDRIDGFGLFQPSSLISGCPRKGYNNGVPTTEKSILNPSWWICNIYCHVQIQLGDQLVFWERTVSFFLLWANLELFLGWVLFLTLPPPYALI